MLLHLLRHAEAEDVSPSGRDADRRLSDAGLKRMKSVAKAIAKVDPGFDLVLVSPYLRARQTALPVLQACRYQGEIVETNALVPEAAPEDVLNQLAHEKAKSVLLVGHQPHMGRLFGRLLTGRTFEIPMKKAALAVFESGSNPSLGPAELKLYAPARLLELLA